jgi:hypothetical protein
MQGKWEKMIIAPLTLEKKVRNDVGNGLVEDEVGAETCGK